MKTIIFIHHRLESINKISQLGSIILDRINLSAKKMRTFHSQPIHLQSDDENQDLANKYPFVVVDTIDEDNQHVEDFECTIEQ